MPLPSPEEQLMRMAIRAAKDALDEGEEPVGTVIVESDTCRTRGRAFQQVKTLSDPTAHATMIALTQLSSPPPIEEDLFVSEDMPPALPTSKNLTLVTTREPDVMCAGAILHFPKISRVIWGMPYQKLGGCGSLLNVFEKLENKISVRGNLMQNQCIELWMQYERLQKKK